MELGVYVGHIPLDLHSKRFVCHLLVIYGFVCIAARSRGLFKLMQRLLLHMFDNNVVDRDSDTVVARWASGAVLHGVANRSCYRRPERRFIVRLRRHGKVAFPIHALLEDGEQ